MVAFHIDWLAHLAFVDRAVPLLRTVLQLATAESLPRLHRVLQRETQEIQDGALACTAHA